MAKEFEIASVRVAVSAEGQLIIRARSTKMADELGLTPDFDRAAAAFAREYGKDEELLSASRYVGNGEISPELDKLYNEAPVFVDKRKESGDAKAG